MTDPTINNEWLEMQDTWKQLIEAASGVQAMALEAGFLHEDASKMGREIFEFLVAAARKQQEMA